MNLTSKMMRQHRRIAIFLFAVLAAFVTESTDALSMVLVWLPMCVLYELAACVLSFWEPHQNNTR